MKACCPSARAQVTRTLGLGRAAISCIWQKWQVDKNWIPGKVGGKNGGEGGLKETLQTFVSSSLVALWRGWDLRGRRGQEDNRDWNPKHLEHKMMSVFGFVAKARAVTTFSKYCVTRLKVCFRWCSSGQLPRLLLWRSKFNPAGCYNLEEKTKINKKRLGLAHL